MLQHVNTGIRAENGQYLLCPTEDSNTPTIVFVTVSGVDEIFLSWTAPIDDGACSKNYIKKVTYSEFTDIVARTNKIISKTSNEKNLRETHKEIPEAVLDMERIMKTIDDSIEADISITADNKIKEIVEFTSTLTKNDQITFMTNLRIALDCFASGTVILSTEEQAKYENMKRIFAEIKGL